MLKRAAYQYVVHTRRLLIQKSRHTAPVLAEQCKLIFVFGFGLVWFCFILQEGKLIVVTILSSCSCITQHYGCLKDGR